MRIVIVNCFDTYEHRVDLLYKVFAEDGHRVRVFTSDFRHIEKSRRSDTKKGFRYFKAFPYRKNMSMQRLYSHAKLSRDIFSAVMKQEDRIDLLWVLVPPNSFVKDAQAVKRQHPHIKLVFDLIDLWPETMPVSRFKDFYLFRQWKQMRDKGLRSADVIALECNLYREVLGNILEGKRVETLYLAKPLKEYRPDLHLSGDRISLCYLGSVNHIIDIEVIGKIIRTFRKKKPVLMHIIGDGEKKDRLVRVCEEAGAEVIYHGKIYDRDEKQRIFDSCDYGLNIMKSSVCVGFTMKSTDYLEFGLPIINNIKGDTWDAVEKYRIGINWQE